MRKILFFLLPFALYASSEEEILSRRIHQHLLLLDPAAAVKEGKQHLSAFPDSGVIQIALITALAEKGDEVEAFELFSSYARAHPEDMLSRQLLEPLTWGILRQGAQSKQLLVRSNALLGAAFTRDIRALPMLLKEIKSSNSLMRSIAAKLASFYGDEPLKIELSRMLSEERVWYVKKELIEAVGRLKMTRCVSALKKLVADPKTSAEEKALAIASLVQMTDSIEEEELAALCSSNRSGLRQLACEVVCHLELKGELERIFPLLSDHNAEVRLSALIVFGLLQPERLKNTVLLEDPASEVAITAAWALFPCDPEKAGSTLKRYLAGRDLEGARLASAALAVRGSGATSLMASTLAAAEDPYVRVNLALGLIGAKSHIEEASFALNAALKETQKSLLMWDSHHAPLFRTLAPSSLHHVETIAHYPHVMDQLVRLELLKVLCILKDPQALVQVKDFLQSQSWGVSGAAAQMLLQEGEEDAFSLVEALLKDPEEKIRVQAALILALVGADPAAVNVLLSAYPHMPPEVKVHILEALGKVGDASCIPFLLEIMSQPYQTLRVIAASALMQCLYH